MMNNIVIINDGQLVTICNVDDNNKVISYKEETISTRLVNDDYIVDRATIAELLDMTEEEFARDYDLQHSEIETVFGIKVLKNAMFTRREKTIGETYTQFLIDRAFRATDMPNFIEPLYDKSLSELTDSDIELIGRMNSLLITLDNRYDYGDAVIEGTIELSTLLSDIYNSRI